MGIWERRGYYTGTHGKKAFRFPLAAVLLTALAAVLAAAAWWAGRAAEIPSHPLTGATLSPAWIEDIPDYSGEPYVELNGNLPCFAEEDVTTDPFERYSGLDDLGRCGTAFANVCRELMPTGDREDISSVTPSGYRNEWYDWIDQGFVYNRCHLIAFFLTGENANEKNLITGTRYLNVVGMFPFESEVGDYARREGHHVLYRVTPVFKGDDLVASGVQMEAWSVEDRGESVCFNVFVYNVQPGVVIDYATGENYAEDGYAPASAPPSGEIGD